MLEQTRPDMAAAWYLSAVVNATASHPSRTPRLLTVSTVSHSNSRESPSQNASNLSRGHSRSALNSRVDPSEVTHDGQAWAGSARWSSPSWTEQPAGRSSDHLSVISMQSHFDEETFTDLLYRN